MIGRTKVIYGDVTPEELHNIMEEYDYIVDMRSATAEPLEKILAKAEKHNKFSKQKPRFKVNVW